MINNADRKGGHIIKDDAGHLWLIDHGLGFHQHDKLRTVLWDYAGENIPPDQLRDITHFTGALENNGSLKKKLGELLLAEEIEAVSKRAAQMLQTPVFPLPDENQRQFPWPPV